MAGSRSLNQEEISTVLTNLRSNRNKCLFILGIRTGFRISEILSITQEQVVQFGNFKNSVTVERKNMKGKTSSRTVVLHPEVKLALEDMGALQMSSKEKLFPISRIHAHRILKSAIAKSKIEGKISTHSMRKTFAQRMYEKLGKDLRKTQLATGHKSLNSLVHYLSADQSEVDRAILES